jgi:hypothetical protein
MVTRSPMAGVAFGGSDEILPSLPLRNARFPTVHFWEAVARGIRKKDALGACLQCNATCRWEALTMARESIGQRGAPRYQPACSVAAAAADLASLPGCHLVATKRRPVMPSASGDTSQSISPPPAAVEAARPSLRFAQFSA